LLNTPEEQQAMLAQLGLQSLEELFVSIPSELRLQRPLHLPPAATELELNSQMEALARQNISAAQYPCFLGGGAYDHFIPAVVDAIASRSEYYTAYTPYQAEASQGTLQVIFEYQTLMCQLTGLGVANASLYEAGSGVAEAVLMALGVTGRQEGEVLVAESVHPDYRRVLATYLANLACQVRVLPTPDGFLDPDDLTPALSDRTVGLVIQSPNFFGHLEEMADLAAAVHRVGGVCIAVFDPISLGILRRPGDCGVDIAVAEGQGLGIPLGYGGPYLGILACRDEPAYVRRLPGRLVGQTTDRHGRRCWVLTLQTREQHIRREKATSNICTNQGLMALRASVYLTALGPQGLRETAELCLRKAHYAAQRLTEQTGAELRFRRPFFKEFTLRWPTSTESLPRLLRQRGFLAALPLGRWFPHLADCFSLAVTEKRTRAEIDALVAALAECQP
jgi:glycine dehydrogenase subunit 1